MPLALDNILAKALEKDPDLRYQTAAELRADLKRLKRDMDSTRHPQSDKAEPPPPLPLALKRSRSPSFTSRI